MPLFSYFKGLCSYILLVTLVSVLLLTIWNKENASMYSYIQPTVIDDMPKGLGITYDELLNHVYLHEEIRGVALVDKLLERWHDDHRVYYYQDDTTFDLGWHIRTLESEDPDELAETYIGLEGCLYLVEPLGFDVVSSIRSLFAGDDSVMTYISTLLFLKSDIYDYENALASGAGTAPKYDDSGRMMVSSTYFRKVLDWVCVQNRTPFLSREHTYIVEDLISLCELNDWNISIEEVLGDPVYGDHREVWVSVDTAATYVNHRRTRIGGEMWDPIAQLGSLDKVVVEEDTEYSTVYAELANKITHRVEPFSCAARESAKNRLLKVNPHCLVNGVNHQNVVLITEFMLLCSLFRLGGGHTVKGLELAKAFLEGGIDVRMLNKNAQSAIVAYYGRRVSLNGLR